MAKILVVDDDVTSRRLMAKAIEQTGHVAVQCSNGKRALEVLTDNLDFELLITDVMMPEVTGRELVQILRGNQLFVDLPILIISSVVEQNQIGDLLALGQARFLVKPLNLSELKRLVNETVSAPETKQKMPLRMTG